MLIEQWHSLFGDGLTLSAFIAGVWWVCKWKTTVDMELKSLEAKNRHLRERISSLLDV